MPGGRRNPQGVASPLKRRSERKSGSENRVLDSPAAAPIIKRSITVKKILPRKTLPSHLVGEPRSSPRVSNSISTPRCSPRVSSKTGKENTEEKAVKCGIGRSKTPRASIVLSTTTSSSLQNSTSFPDPLGEPKTNNVLSPIPVNASPCLGEDDSGMAKKVRRSYSRLEMSLYPNLFATESHTASQDDSSDTSTPNQSRLSRRSFFGFDNLLSQDVLADVSPVTAKTGARQESEPDLQVESSAMPHISTRELATNIPGIALVKEKRRRRKIPQIDKSDLDEWAAQMNAQFDEAEKFNLLVE